ncbi:LuxR C-terminal-related transcriptional regulator [Actinomyces gerencseriae]
MRVLIADDSVLLRQGLALILAEGGHAGGAELGDGRALEAETLRLRPELVIADIRMPPSHTDEGLRAATRIRRQWGRAPILLLSQYVVAGYVPELLADGGGGIGYLLKDRVTDIDSFLEAVERVARGELVLDPDVVAQVMHRSRRDDPIESLTPRERDVLALMAEGCTNAAIAARLVVTEGAVEKHTQRIFAKLGLLPGSAVHRRVKAVLTLLSA